MENKKEHVICVYVGAHNYSYINFKRFGESSKAPVNYERYLISVPDEESIKKYMDYIKTNGKQCALYLSEGSSYVCSVINERLGYPSPSPLSIIICRNKYQTRLLVDEFDWFCGFNIGDPVDELVKNIKSYPCMIKPTMYDSGIGAYRCVDEASLRANLHAVATDKTITESIQSMQSELSLVSDDSLDDVCELVKFNMMAETFINTNDMGTFLYYMEVFVTRDGEIVPYSFVELLCFQDGMFLAGLVPPIHLEGGIKQFEDYAISIGKKLFSIGYRNQCFMMEFWRFSDGRFLLMEINPRLSTHAADIPEQYSGNNIFHDVTDFFVNNKLPAHTPFSVLKSRFENNTHEDQYTILIDYSSRDTGSVSTLVDYDLLEELSMKGHVVRFVKNRDTVFVTGGGAVLGNPIAMLTIKGTWNEIVKEEKSLRKRLYPRFDDCHFEYPSYFEEKC